MFRTPEKNKTQFSLNQRKNAETKVILRSMFKIIHTSVIFKVTKGKDGTPEYTPVAIAPVTCPSDASVKRGVGKGDDIATKAQKTNACLFHEAQTCDSVPFGAVAIKESRPRKKTTVKDSDGVFNDENLARLVALRMQGVRALQAFMKVNRVCYNEGKAALTSPAWLGGRMRSHEEVADDGTPNAGIGAAGGSGGGGGS